MIFLRSANIPETTLENLLETIYTNIELRKELESLQKEEEDRQNSSGIKSEKASLTGNTAESQALRAFQKATDEIRKKMKKIQLDSEFIPNSYSHLKKWKNKLADNIKPYTSEIDEETVEKIMLLDVDNIWKIMLMMGIGVFIEHESVDYSEIMKKLATDQKLYLILATTDYIYGTNYQFCHGYLSKDLTYITQEKMIQAFGRVGRSNAQRNYSLRVRFNELLMKLLLPAPEKPEIANMNRLFGSDE